MRRLAAMLIGVLVAGTASAQDGLRSPVLPEGGPAAQTGFERDLFRVPPDFYRRPPDPDASRLFFPVPLSTFVPVAYWYPFLDYGNRIVSSERHLARGFTRRRVAREGPPYEHTPPTPSITLPAPVPGKPKTFYVIPGCYAGDRRPEREWLPSGCDVSRLRIIPPA